MEILITGGNWFVGSNIINQIIVKKKDSHLL